jgi:hypothetical protein
MASYAIPLTANGTANNHHGHGHTRSQHRRSFLRPTLLQRIDSESPTSQLKHDPFTQEPQANGHTHTTHHSHRKSRQNRRIPSPLPSPSLLAPNGFLTGDPGGDNILPIAHPSPLKANFEMERVLLTRSDHLSQDIVYVQNPPKYIILFRWAMSHFTDPWLGNSPYKNLSPQPYSQLLIS